MQPSGRLGFGQVEGMFYVHLTVGEGWSADSPVLLLDRTLLALEGSLQLEIVRLESSRPVWYDDGPDKLFNLDALRFSLSFECFGAMVRKGKDEIGPISILLLESLRGFWASKSTLESQPSFCSFRIILFGTVN